MVKIKGNEIEEPTIRDSFDRRAVRIQNSIMTTLKQLGIERDNVRLKMERNTRLKARASVSWYFEGRNLKYSYSLMPKFIENLYIIDKVLFLEVPLEYPLIFDLEMSWTKITLFCVLLVKPKGAMSTITFAAITSLKMILLCKNLKSFWR